MVGIFREKENSTFSYRNRNVFFINFWESGSFSGPFLKFPQSWSWSTHTELQNPNLPSCLSLSLAPLLVVWKLSIKRIFRYPPLIPPPFLSCPPFQPILKLTAIVTTTTIPLSTPYYLTLLVSDSHCHNNYHYSCILFYYLTLLVAASCFHINTN